MWNVISTQWMVMMLRGEETGWEREREGRRGSVNSSGPSSTAEQLRVTSHT